MARLPLRVFGSTLKRAGALLSKIVPNLQVYVPPRSLLTGENAQSSLSMHLALAALQAVAWSVGLIIAFQPDLQAPGPRLIPRSRLVALAGLTMALCVTAGWQLAQQAQRELLASDGAWASGDAGAAIAHARRAAAGAVRDRMPPGPGTDDLPRFARAMETQAMLRRALGVARGRRVGHASRSLWQPNTAALEDSERAIARLLAAPVRTAATAPSAVAPQRRPWLDPPTPDPPPHPCGVRYCSAGPSLGWSARSASPCCGRRGRLGAGPRFAGRSVVACVGAAGSDVGAVDV